MQRNTILNRQWEEYILLFNATVRVWKIFFDQTFWRTLEWADLKWSDFIRADISMGARASSAHFMSDQIKSDKVYKKCKELTILEYCVLTGWRRVIWFD